MITIILLIAVLVACFVCWCTDNEDVAGLLLTVLALIIGAYLLLYKYPQFVCEQKTKLSGYTCTWDFFAGCQVNINGQWTPYEKWRVVE